LSAYAQEDKGLVRVFDIEGNAYIFTGRNRPVYNVKEGQYLKKGQIIATSDYSTAGIDFSGNGVLVMAPNTQVLISSITKRNLRHIILIAGEVYFRTKNGLFRNRPPGVVTSVRGFPHGYLGKEYKIKFIPDEQSLEVMDKNVSVYPLLALTEKGARKDENPESFKEGYKQDIDQELDWRELLDEFDSTDTSTKLEKKKKWDLTFILRGVNVRENQFITTDTTTVTSGSGTDADGTNSTINDEELNPKERYFDARLKFGTRRKKGNGVIIFNGWLEYGNQTDFYREPLQFLDGRKDGRSHLEIAEAYYQFSWLNSDITLGKKVLKAGYSKLYSIMDILTPKDLYDPLDRRDLGNYLVQFDNYIGDVSLSYALMPYFLPNKAPKRFLSESDTVSSDGELVRPNREYPRSKPSTFQHYLQAKTSLGGWDLTASVFRGPYQFPAFNQKIKRGTGNTLDCADNACEVVENYAIVDRYSLGFSKLLGKLLFYSEHVYQNADSRKDDNWYKFLVGLNWKTTDFDNFKLFDNIEYFIEYTKEKITLDQDTVDPTNAILDIQEGESKLIPITSSLESRRDHRNNIIGRFAFQYNDETKLTANYDFNFEFSDFLQIYGLEYSPKDNFNIRLNYELFQLNLTRRSQGSTIQTPFGDLDTSQETEITREFQRYTIRLDYIF
jgi:hypothetical protein